MSEKTVTLTPAQARVITLIKAGWELGFSKTLSKYWLQERGIGCGGPTEKVARPTGLFLEKNKLIEVSKDGFPVQKFALVEGCKMSPDGKSVSIPQHSEE
jgi:hypothetical protein